MKKIIIPCIIVIVAILTGLILYSYHVKAIIDVSTVTEINVPAPSIKDPQLKYKSFTDTQSIAQFIKILNSSKSTDTIDNTEKSYNYKAYPIAIHNKDGNITNVQLAISSEDTGFWVISGNDGTAISKTYIIPPKQANELYNILKDIPN